jgi:pimeloyl-ACP methyl ester esterase
MSMNRSLIHYETVGRGEKTIVFLHGFGGFGKMWGWQVGDLSPLAKLIMPDLPGHGESLWQGEGLADMAEEVRAVLDQERIAKAFFVASSFGGLVALKFWEKYPAKVSGLSFVGSLPRFTAEAGYPAGLDTQKIRKLAGQLEGDLATTLDLFFRSLFTRFERESLQYGLIKGLRRQSPLPRREALLAVLTILETTDLRAVLGRVDVPVQFIFGDSDYLCPQGLILPLQALCQTAQFNVGESSGHFPFLTRPDDVNKLFKEFIGP